MDSVVVDSKEIQKHPEVIQPIPTRESVHVQGFFPQSTRDEFDGAGEVYVEPEDNYSNNLEYERTGTDQGIVIIFNQLKFRGGDREGSAKDVGDIKDVLSRLGYNIKEKYVYIDYTKEEILYTINEICEEDLSNRNSLILFFMTHGGNDNILGTGCGGVISTNDIWLKLANHKDLENKPKLFIFQACKGSSALARYEKASKYENYKITKISEDSIPPRDVIICYSTSEDMVSFRDPEHGSWLVQEICKNFLAYGRRDDVHSLLTRALKCVSHYDYGDYTEMPVILSTLSKRFYLCNSKDRRSNIAVHQSYDEVHDVLKRLTSKVEVLEKLLS